MRLMILTFSDLKCQRLVSTVRNIQNFEQKMFTHFEENVDAILEKTLTPFWRKRRHHFGRGFCDINNYSRLNY